MPLQSKAQLRKFYSMVASGEMSQDTLDEWKRSTKDIKSLPDKKRKLKKHSPTE
jgi:hypothetical protein